MTFTVRLPEEHGEFKTFEIEAERDGEDVSITSVKTPDNIMDFLQTDGDRQFLLAFLTGAAAMNLKDPRYSMADGPVAPNDGWRYEP